MSAPVGPRLLGPAEVRSLAAGLDLRPTKQRGQNFVIDPNTVRRIVRESGVGRADVVVEVGPRSRLPDARAARGRRPRGGRRGRRAARGVAAGDRGDVRPRSRRSPRRRRGRRPPHHRAARSCSDGAGGQPALQRLGSRAAAPAGAAAVAGARSGDGAVRGRRPAGSRAGEQGLRHPVGQGGLVRRRTPGRRDRPARLLAGAQRRLGPGRLDPPRPAGHDGLPRAGLRRGRRGLRPASQDAAGGAARRRPGRPRRRRQPSSAAGVDPEARGEVLDIHAFVRIAEALDAVAAG